MRTVRPASLATFASALLLSAVLSTSCVTGGQRPPSSRPLAPRVTLDGTPSEWPDGVAALADPDYLFFRLGLEETTNLQNSPATLSLLLDADGKSSTGARLDQPPPAASLGVDLEIQFSPPPGRGGVAVFALDPSGTRTPLTHDQVGLVVAPTYASQWFEVRLSRHVTGHPPLEQAMGGSTSARVLFSLVENDQVVGWSDPEVFVRPLAAPAAPLADVSLPSKSPGAIRVVSWNVFKSSPMTNPGPFARVLTALEPDIILVQEWDADAATLAAWCTALLTGEGQWHARTGPGGVGIIARHPLDPLGPDAIPLPAEAGAEPGQNIRWIAALARTPLGDAAVSSLHLKCCGSVGSPEDQRRLAEARAVNEAMRRALTGLGAGLRVIGGDFNLVGSRPPLDILRAALDDDGSDLGVADPFVLGDPSNYTWRDSKSPFPPGRLDYCVYSDAFAQVDQTFVLDTRRLTDAALARMGLDRADTAASDHLPLVVDLRPR